MTVKQKTLPDVISRVIEDLAMMIVDPVSEVEDFQPQLMGWIDFDGPVQGRLRIRCREQLAQILASNLLGTAPEDLETQANAWDALAELLNVVCGNLVSSLYDAERCFTLSTPQINTIEAEDSETNTDQHKNETANREMQVCLLLVENEPAEFSLVIEP